MRRTLSLISAITAVGLLTGGLLASAGASGPDDLADHPLTGVWLAMANPPLETDPHIAVPSVYSADGTVIMNFPPNQVGQAGVQYNSTAVGTWEADSERGGHFTAVQVLTDANAPSWARSRSMGTPW